jgi:hypothetical protein
MTSSGGRRLPHPRTIMFPRQSLVALIGRAGISSLFRATGRCNAYGSRASRAGSSSCHSLRKSNTSRPLIPPPTRKVGPESKKSQSSRVPTPPQHCSCPPNPPLTPSPTGGEGAPTPRLEPFLPPATAWTRSWSSRHRPCFFPAAGPFHLGHPEHPSAARLLPHPLPNLLCLREIQRGPARAGAKKRRGRSGGRQREMSSGSPQPEKTRLGMATGEEEVVERSLVGRRQRCSLPALEEERTTVGRTRCDRWWGLRIWAEARLVSRRARFAGGRGRFARPPPLRPTTAPPAYTPGRSSTRLSSGSWISARRHRRPGVSRATRSRSGGGVREVEMKDAGRVAR